MHAREDTIKRRAEYATQTSFAWVLHGTQDEDAYTSIGQIKNTFNEWVKGHGSLFWVCGKAGSGKSTLMRKVYRDLIAERHILPWDLKAGPVFAHMFFTREGTPRQRSREGLLRSLLATSLEHDDLLQPVLGGFLYKAKSKDPRSALEIQWTYEELKKAFETLLTLASSSRPFCFFIDGLDEYNVLATDQEHLVEYHLEQNGEEGRRIRRGWYELSQMVKQASNSKWVKICVSSRPMNEFELAFTGTPQFRLEALTANDIKDYVQSEVGKVALPESQAHYETCANEIVHKAWGVFLWVRIATEILVDGIINAIKIQELMDMLRKLPSELGGPQGLYMRMIESLSDECRRPGRRMLDILLHARHNITASILKFALDYTADEAVQREIKKLALIEINHHSEEMEKRLRSCTAGLLEIQPNPNPGPRRDLDGYDKAHISRAPVVQFIHLTARDFLIRPDVQIRLKTFDLSSDFDPHMALLTASLLRLKCIGGTTDLEDLWGAIKDALYYARNAEISTGAPATALLDDMDHTAEAILSCSVTRDIGGHSYFRENPDYFSDFVKSHHWTLLEPQESGGRIIEWEDNFMSLAVQASLTLYLSEKLSHGLEVGAKPGRPLLAYAVTPKINPNDMLQYSDFNSDTLGHGISEGSTIAVLLQHGADPNAEYLGEDPWHGHRGKTVANGWTQSTWTCALSQALQRSTTSVRRMRVWNWHSWKLATKLLIEYNADPFASVIQVHIDNDRTRHIKKYTPLFVVVGLSWTYLKGDKELPLMLIERRARLASGELALLGTELGVGEGALLEWLPQLSETIACTSSD